MVGEEATQRAAWPFLEGTDSEIQVHRSQRVFGLGWTVLATQYTVSGKTLLLPGRSYQEISTASQAEIGTLWLMSPSS